MTPPRDGDGDGEMVAQIIPLRRRAGPIAPARNPDHRPRGRSSTRRASRRRPLSARCGISRCPSFVAARYPTPCGPPMPLPRAPRVHQGWAARWALIPAVLAVAAVAVVALALVVGGLLLAQSGRGSPHAGASASRGRVPARAAHESSKPRSTTSHRARTTGAARHPHSTQDRHAHHATATHPAAQSTPTVGGPLRRAPAWARRPPFRRSRRLPSTSSGVAPRKNQRAAARRRPRLLPRGADG